MPSDETLRAVRLQKRNTLLSHGVPAYADGFTTTHSCPCPGVGEGETVRVAGRLMLMRDMGKTVFADLHDQEGKIQIMLSVKHLPQDALARFRETVDLGDILGCEGVLFRTRTDERTVQVSAVQVLAKALLPLPDKHHGLKDDETRFRKRYLEILTDPVIRSRFRTRSRVIREIRHFLEARGFEEVETPILQAVASGAAANPFETTHRASGRSLFLRIAPETYLKRLIVAGYDKVFEIGRNFRNEGIDRSHLQEFTMLEWYCVFWRMEDNVQFIQQLIQHVVMQTYGSLSVPFQAMELNFQGPWRRVDYRDLVLEDSGIDVLAHTSAETLIKEIRRQELPVGDLSDASLGTAIDKLYKMVSRPRLIQPTLLVHHPASLLPLARPNDADPRVVDAFQVLVNGWEIVKAYSELVDPVLQRRAFEEQAQARTDGDEEAMQMDEPFLEAMEHGMPPNSGLGLGIDRFVALLTDQVNLKEAVIFPLGT